MRVRELTAGQKENKPIRDLDIIGKFRGKGYKSRNKWQPLCDREVFVQFLAESKKKGGGKKKERTEKRLRKAEKKTIFYSGFTFQNTAAAATLKTNTPTAA